MKNLLACALLFGTASFVSAATITATATKDVTAKAASPSSNFGTATNLQTSAQSGFEKISYLQFAVSGVPTGATGISAQLKVRSNTTATNRPVSAHSVTSTSWSETGLTWSNKPTLGATLSTVSTHTSGADSVWDVSTHVTGNGTFALALDSTYAADTTFSSREGTTAPTVVVTYTPPGERQAAFVKSYGGINIPSTEGSGAKSFLGADEYYYGDFWDTANGSWASRIEGPNRLNQRVGIHNRHHLVWAPATEVMRGVTGTGGDAALSGPKVISMVSLATQNSGGNGLFPVYTTDYWPGGGKMWDDSTTSFGTGIDRITHGEFDSYFTTLANSLHSSGVPIIFRPWMEMNGEHNPQMAKWQGGVGVGEPRFRAAWVHVWSLFEAAGATLKHADGTANPSGNVIFVFCPQTFIGPNVGDWRNYWPGDRYVDWTGVDIYGNTFKDAADNPAEGRDFYRFFTQCNNGAGFNHTNNKPMLVCEGGWDSTDGASQKLDQDVTVSPFTSWFTKTGAGTKSGTSSANAKSLIEHMESSLKNDYKDVLGYVAWYKEDGTVLTINTSAASKTQYINWSDDTFFTLTRP